jgi:hypothetical protein
MKEAASDSRADTAAAEAAGAAAPGARCLSPFSCYSCLLLACCWQQELWVYLGWPAAPDLDRPPLLQMARAAAAAAAAAVSLRSSSVVLELHRTGDAAHVARRRLPAGRRAGGHGGASLVSGHHWLLAGCHRAPVSTLPLAWPSAPPSFTASGAACSPAPTSAAPPAKLWS